MLDALSRDIRYSLRGLKKSPAFTLAVVSLLALGIGVTTAVFTVYEAAVLRPIEVPEPESLVLLRAERQGKDYVIFNPVFEALRERQRTLSGLFAVSEDAFLTVKLAGENAPSYTRGSLVSADYFAALGVSPAMGRLLTAEDDAPVAAGGPGCAAVLSHAFWKEHFEGSPSVLGRTLEARGLTCTIVGVTEPNFQGHQPGSRPGVWLPLRAVTAPRLLASQSMAFFAGVMGRLRPGVSREQAAAELNGLFQQIEMSRPQRSSERAPRGADYHLRVLDGAQGLAGLRRELGKPLTLVLGLATTVLLIAISNVSSLLLARGRARRPHEFAVRRALGARPLDLARQVAVEATLLGAMGALVGWWLAGVASPALLSWGVFRGRPFTLALQANPRVMAVALAALCFTILVTSLVGAGSLWKTRQGELAEGNRTVPRPGRHLERGLVAVQLALSLMLVAAGTLMLRTVAVLYAIDPGFAPEHVVSLEVRDERPGVPPSEGFAQDAQRAASYRALEGDIQAVPGVRAASLSWLGLFGGADQWVGLIDAQHPDDKSEVRLDHVTSRYFDTVGMRVVHGRDFTERDDAAAPRVAVVNEALVRSRFRGGEALGRRLAFTYPPEEREKPYTVVGVVRDSKYRDLRESKTGPMVWVPLAQANTRPTSIMVRVQPGSEDSVARAVSQRVPALDPFLMVRRVTTLSGRLDETMRHERMLLALGAGFGAVALLMAAAGVYGTIAHAVANRTREIGIRLALGASPRRVVALVVADAAALAALGVAGGVPLALGAGSALQAYLFGVPPRDAVSLAASCLVLAAAALAAGYLPARRASRIDPNVALRCE
jgi:predicted permease